MDFMVQQPTPPEQQSQQQDAEETVEEEGDANLESSQATDAQGPGSAQASVNPEGNTKVSNNTSHDLKSPADSTVDQKNSQETDPARGKDEHERQDANDVPGEVTGDSTSRALSLAADDELLGNMSSPFLTSEHSAAHRHSIAPENNPAVHQQVSWCTPA